MLEWVCQATGGQLRKSQCRWDNEAHQIPSRWSRGQAWGGSGGQLSSVLGDFVVLVGCSHLRSTVVASCRWRLGSSMLRNYCTFVSQNPITDKLKGVRLDRNDGSSCLCTELYYLGTVHVDLRSYYV